MLLKIHLYLSLVRVGSTSSLPPIYLGPPGPLQQLHTHHVLVLVLAGQPPLLEGFPDAAPPQSNVQVLPYPSHWRTYDLTLQEHS